MNVEQLISDVASEIVKTGIESGFSTRVLDRIQVAERRARKVRAIGAVTMLVVCLGLGVFIARGSRVEPGATSAEPLRASANPIAPPVTSVSSPGTVQIASGPAPAKKRSAPSTPVIPTAEQEWLARAVPALAPATPITIEKPHTAESIQPASLQIPLMGMDVIGSDPLSIAPIGGIRH